MALFWVIPAAIAGIPYKKFSFKIILLLKYMTKFISSLKNIIGFKKPNYRKIKKKNNKIYTMNKRGQYWFISYYQ